MSSVYINCGSSSRTTVDGNLYADDKDPLTGPVKFYPGVNWVASSTGIFMDGTKETLTSTNKSLTGDHLELLKDARLSPLSLTYYGYCLSNGRYKVKLYFAETMFTDDQTFSSLGRRIFDIYIQVNVQMIGSFS